MTRDFRSDNVLPAAPEILEAVVRANAGAATSYGGDEITARVRRECGEIFESSEFKDMNIEESTQNPEP